MAVQRRLAAILAADVVGATNATTDPMRNAHFLEGLRKAPGQTE